MIITEQITIDGRDFVRTFSDRKVMIERDGDLYSEAIDPIGSGRTYTETDIPTESEDGEAAESDFVKALEDLGAKFDEEDNS